MNRGSGLGRSMLALLLALATPLLALADGSAGDKPTTEQTEGGEEEPECE